MITLHGENRSETKIKAIPLENKLISINDFDKVQISFDAENVYVLDVELRNGNFLAVEKYLERKLVLQNI
jgi:hypothetical protein